MSNVPASGSCARCLASLDLISVKLGGAWYCSPTCARGGGEELRERGVPEAWLYPAPRRCYGKRRPTELR